MAIGRPQNVCITNRKAWGSNVVRRNIEALRGSVELSTRPGEGTAITLRLPLTLAVIAGLNVRAGGRRT